MQVEVQYVVGAQSPHLGGGMVARLGNWANSRSRVRGAWRQTRPWMEDANLRNDGLRRDLSCTVAGHVLIHVTFSLIPPRTGSASYAFLLFWADPSKKHNDPPKHIDPLPPGRVSLGRPGRG